jgi:co-chaperonin GroES (HSP10)
VKKQAQSTIQIVRKLESKNMNEMLGFQKNAGVNINAWKVSALKPLNDNVIVTDMDFGEQKTNGGIILQSDNGKAHGVHPRWAKVYAVGPEQKDVSVGQWILMEHGRWTRGIKIEDTDGEKIIRKVDTNCMLMVSDEAPPEDAMIGREL